MENKKSPNKNLYQEIKKIKTEIDYLYTQEIEKKLVFLKQKYYETAGKAIKLLARKLRKQQANTTIQKIQDPISKQLSYKSEDIQRVFENYYKNLYTQKQKVDHGKINSFFASLNLPLISNNWNAELSADITEEEINKAISKLKTNKSPGPDGFSSEWYKMFRQQLVPILLPAFNHVLHGGELPPSWREATISAIPKEGKNKEECTSCRPISVLNIDYKLFTSVLAKRLELLMPALINSDQTGFICDRQTQDNVRRTLQIISHIHESKVPAVLLSLDAEKAFDSVNWSFLKCILTRFNFHEKFIRVIQNIYSCPIARIKINGNLSETITLERGTRQGCPLSPLLFALFIEPLAQWIRQNTKIKGINIKDDVHKIALFADDILAYLRDPNESLPELWNTLHTFGSMSGFNLNIKKNTSINL